MVLDDPRPAAYCVAGRPAAIVLTSGALAVLDPPQLGAVLAHERAHLAHGDHRLHTLTQGLAAAFPGIPLFARGAAEVARLTEMSADDTAARASGRPALVAALLAIATGTAGPAPRTTDAAASVLATDPAVSILGSGGAATLDPGSGSPAISDSASEGAATSGLGDASTRAPGPRSAPPPGAALAAATHAVPARVERLLCPPTRARSAALAAALTLVLALVTATPPALTLLLVR